MSNLSATVLAVLADLSALFSKSEKALGRIKGEKEKAFAATDAALAKSFGVTWFTLTKGDVKKGVKFAAEVEACRLAIRDMQLAAKAGNPDSAWSELKAYVKKAHFTPIGDADTTKGEGETRAARRSAEEIFAGHCLDFAAYLLNTNKKQGLTEFQAAVRDHVAAINALAIKHKVKTTK